MTIRKPRKANYERWNKKPLSEQDIKFYEDEIVLKEVPSETIGNHENCMRMSDLIPQESDYWWTKT